MTDRLVTSTGLVLRPWQMSDREAVLAAFTSPDMAHQSREPINTPDAAERWLRARQEDWQQGRGYSWAVVDSKDTLLGQVAVTDVEHRHQTGWVSYWTVPAARRQGVATHAVRALATWAFNQLDLFRLELGHRTNNPASCRVATAAGFLFEGLERQRLRYGQERFDVERHARLATDPAPCP